MAKSIRYLHKMAHVNFRAVTVGMSTSGLFRASHRGGKQFFQWWLASKMDPFSNKKRRMSFQRVRTSKLYCCVPRCTSSYLYSSELSFHLFPVDAAVRAKWLAKIRRDKFSPTPNSRVCSRHFQSGDFVVTPAGLKRLRKGAIPVLFSWNEYSLPNPRPSVWERRPRAERPNVTPTPDLTEDSESVMTTSVAPDHDYCFTPATAVMAHEVTNENEALHLKIRRLEKQVEVLQQRVLQQRFGMERLAGSDDDIRFYTR